jgi:hypothetical protein
MMTMNKDLNGQLRQPGLHATAHELDDLIARATKPKWSPLQLIEAIARSESADRAARNLQRPTQAGAQHNLGLTIMNKFEQMHRFSLGESKSAYKFNPSKRTAFRAEILSLSLAACLLLSQMQQKRIRANRIRIVHSRFLKVPETLD